MELKPFIQLSFYFRQICGSMDIDWNILVFGQMKLWYFVFQCVWYETKDGYLENPLPHIVNYSERPAMLWTCLSSKRFGKLNCMASAAKKFEVILKYGHSYGEIIQQIHNHGHIRETTGQMLLERNSWSYEKLVEYSNFILWDSPLYSVRLYCCNSNGKKTKRVSHIFTSDDKAWRAAQVLR